MATGDGLTSAKAIAGAVVGFVAPGAGQIALAVTEQSPGGSVITGGEWITALCVSIVAAAATGFTVHRVENKPKL